MPRCSRCQRHTKRTHATNGEQDETKGSMMADVILEKHQSDATRLLASSVMNGWPIVMVECESKFVPDEKVKVLAVSLINLDTNDHMLVPIARLFEEAPTVACYAPRLENVSVTEESVLNDVYGSLRGWKLHVTPKLIE